MLETLIEIIKSENFKLIIATLVLVFEFWAGRTDKIKSGSLLELILVSLRLVKPIEPKGPDATA